MMKFAFVRLNKGIAKSKFIGKGIDVSIMGLALIKEGADLIAKEKGISEEESLNCILESFMRTKDKITKQKY